MYSALIYFIYYPVDYFLRFIMLHCVSFRWVSFRCISFRFVLILRFASLYFVAFCCVAFFDFVCGISTALIVLPNRHIPRNPKDLVDI